MVDVPLSPMKLVDQPVSSERHERAARLRLGYRNERSAPSLPPTPSELRALRLERAIAFLTRHGVAVSVCDRNSQIRRYRLSAKRDNYLADDVVAYAIQRGFESDRG
jgi:hypothetical protein